MAWERRKHDHEGISMLRTIMIGTCMSVQGLFVRRLEDGRMVVRLDGRLYAGMPVERVTLQAA
jgi:hypothetical protein